MNTDRAIIVDGYRFDDWHQQGSAGGKPVIMIRTDKHLATVFIQKLNGYVVGTMPNAIVDEPDKDVQMFVMTVAQSGTEGDFEILVLVEDLDVPTMDISMPTPLGVIEPTDVIGQGVTLLAFGETFSGRIIESRSVEDGTTLAVSVVLDITPDALATSDVLAGITSPCHPTDCERGLHVIGCMYGGDR